MGLTLLVGPANAGKIATLLERYVAVLHDEPVLIVPNGADVERVERRLLRDTAALLGGTIVTFDGLFERIARGNGSHRRRLGDAQRRLLLRRLAAGSPQPGLEPSARSAGFADALGLQLAELESGLVEPDELGGALAELYRGYRAELDRLDRWSREGERRHAAERLAGDLDAWDGRPVFAYGFEDLTGAQWALVETLAGRTAVTVSLPYEPGRPAFAALERTARDLQGLAGARVEELPRRPSEAIHPALAHLERRLFDDTPVRAASDGALRFLEGAGARGVAELVAAEILELLRAGVPAAEIVVVPPSLERWRAPLETAFSSLEVPYAVEGPVRLGTTPFGVALHSLLRFAWLGGGRRELFRYLRSPYSGLARGHADYVEGRLRGRAVHEPARVEEVMRELRGGAALPALDGVRAAGSPLAAAGELAHALLRAAHGVERPPVGEAAKLDLRAHEAVLTLTSELAEWETLASALSREEVVSALEGAALRSASPGEPGRVAVLDLARARTRRPEILFLLGLEEGSLPRKADVSPFLGDDERRELEGRSRRARLPERGALARDRYLFYTACTRPSRRLYLVREAASDEGTPGEASPFWHEVRALVETDDAERWTRRRPLSALVWPLERAPTERERLRATAALAAAEPEAARAIARANGWERRLERATGASRRPTRLTHPQVLAELRERKSFGVTELETFAECSSMWLLERVVDPKSIDGEVDARLRGSIAHSALQRFFTGLPKRVGTERVSAERLDESLDFMHECLDEAIGSGLRLDATELARRELEHGLRRDLEGFVRQEAASPSPLVPRRFEVSFGSERSAPELQRGLQLGDFTLSGKIDRIDVDPFSARAIVQDYKSGKTAHSAAKIDSELRLQVPLYMLVLRDLVGVEPLGGVYRALGGERPARGLLRAEARADGVPGFQRNDYLDDDEFWAQIERARTHAETFVGRIRGGDIVHDPKGGGACPSWCRLAALCRIEHV